MKVQRTTSALLIAITLSVLRSRFATADDDDKPHVVIVVGTLHYSPELTMPVFAKELERFGFRTTVVMGEGNPEKKTEDVLPGIEALADADLAIFFMRFLKLPDKEWQPIEDYLKSGKPVIGLRTANHSFKYPQGHARFEWNDGFGRRALGTPYVVHQTSETKISVLEEALGHPIMTNVTKKNWVSPGTLYLTRLEEDCVPLVTGSGDGRARTLKKAFGTIEVKPHESDVVAWAWKNEWGGKVFGTSFGHPGDFAEESFVRMLVNAVHWSVDRPLPSADVKVSTWLPAHSKVSGELPAEDFPAGESAFVRGFVNVLVAGTTRLEINSVDGLTLWVDDKQVDDLDAPIRLEKGRRMLTFGFSPKQRQSGLRVELKAMDGQARFQPEGGL